MADRKAIFRACERFLVGHGPSKPSDVMAAMAEELHGQDADKYGAGAIIEDFERSLCELFDKPAAMFAPSGTMAQQISLRIWSEAKGCSTVAFHPTSHLELHEQNGYARLHGLSARLVGDRHRTITRADLDNIREPVAALLLELPQREIGGQLPAWSEIEAQAAWATEQGAALHLDGARIWETTPHYNRSLADIARPFDSTYVSFYKILGGIAGAALLGSEEHIAQARVWLRRHGGNLISMYPMVASARAGVRDRLPKIPAYCQRAVGVAAVLTSLRGVRVTPDPPQTNMMHAYFPFAADALLDASASLARERGVALITHARACEVPGYCASEITIGDGASAIPDAEIAALMGELLERAGAAAQ